MSTSRVRSSLPGGGLHVAQHASGGADPFTSAQLIEAVVKRLQVTGGPTTLTMGAVADGEFLKRDGTNIIGAAGGGASGDICAFPGGTRYTYPRAPGHGDDGGTPTNGGPYGQQVISWGVLGLAHAFLDAGGGNTWEGALPVGAGVSAGSHTVGGKAWPHVVLGDDVEDDGLNGCDVIFTLRSFGLPVGFTAWGADGVQLYTYVPVLGSGVTLSIKLAVLDPDAHNTELASTTRNVSSTDGGYVAVQVAKAALEASRTWAVGDCVGLRITVSIAWDGIGTPNLGAYLSALTLDLTP